MRLIKIVNISLKDCSHIKDKDIISLIAIILSHNDQCMIVDELLDYGFSKEEVNALFKRINNYFSLKKTKDGYLLAKEDISDNKINLVSNMWGINEIDAKLAFETNSPDQYLANILYKMRHNLSQTNLNKPSEEDVDNLEIYYNRIYLGDLIAKYELGMSKKDFALINMWLLKTNIPPSVFKYVFEQSVIQNQHHNFIANFFDKIIASYNKHKVSSIKEAIKFNNERNTNVSKSSKQYVKPVYEEQDYEVLSEEEIMKLKGKIYEGN